MTISETRIRKFKMSEKDKEYICNYEPKSPPCNEPYMGVVVNKPWGYEYLMFENSEISIWLLYIRQGSLTSMHCHPNKKTSLLIISGEAVCSTLDEKLKLKEKEGIIIEKGVFH